MDNARRTGAALEAHFQFLLWLIPAVARFPRSQKLLLTDRIQTAALDVLDSLVEATYTRERRVHLARAEPRAPTGGNFFNPIRTYEAASCRRWAM
ncbi:MAG: four helix bundle protein [Rhodomicrobium sp.]